MPANIGENVIVEEGIARVAESDVERLAKHRLRTGDIVYSRRGDVERRALVREENDGWLCGTGCLRVRFGDQSDVRSEFVSYLLGDEGPREWIVRHAVGATMLNLNTSILAGVPLTVPDPPTQQAIVDVLRALDDKIAANNKLAATADELGLSLVRREIASGLTEDAPLSSMATIVMGSSPRGEAINDTGDGVVFHQGIRDFGLRTPATRLWTTVPTRIAESGDILVSVRAPVGEVNVAHTGLCIGRGLAALRSVDGHSATLLGVLRACRDVWEPFNSEGTVFGSINRVQLHDVRLPRVRAEAAEKLEHDLASLEGTIRSAEEENARLAATRDALLPALMSGRLTVDAERETTPAALEGVS
jgi:type I restriction enzyme S subunit